MIRRSAMLPLAGCGTVRAEHALTGTPQEAYAGAVRIVMDGAPVEDSYQEVAILHASGTELKARLPEVLRVLQAEAARLGCNAVIRVCSDQGASQASAIGVGVSGCGYPEGRPPLRVVGPLAPAGLRCPAEADPRTYPPC